MVGDRLRQVIGVDLVGQLSNDDLWAAVFFFDIGHTAHHDGSTAGGVGVVDSLLADDLTGGGEVGALHIFHDRFKGRGFVGLWILQAPEDSVSQFAQVVRRNVGGHTDGNTAGAIHQQVRNAGRQHGRFGALTVVVGDEVDGVFANVAHHFHRQWRQATLRITHGGGAVVTA